MCILVYAPQLAEKCKSALAILNIQTIEANASSSSLPASINGVIIEANQPNAGAGFLLALAVQNKLPVLCLVEKGRPLPEPLDTVRSCPTYNRQLKLVRYSNGKVRRYIEQFAASCAGKGTEQPSIKFTLRLTPELDRYLTWRAASERAEKAQFIRQLITSQVMAQDEAYQEYLTKS
jgi:hypothetical protein